jgi:hypothetical protein
MKNLALALALATTLGAAAVVSTPAPAEARRAVYRVGYPPAYFAPAYPQRAHYAPAFPAHVHYAPAYYDHARYRGVITAMDYGFPLYNDWQIRWRPDW